MNGHDSCVLVTGGFDPIHGGHIDYFQDAKLLSTYLIVGVNSDEWLRRKKGRNFMSWESRKRIIDQMNIVDYVIDFDDSDGSANDAIKQCLEKFDNVIVIIYSIGSKIHPQLNPYCVSSIYHPLLSIKSSSKISSSSSSYSV